MSLASDPLLTASLRLRCGLQLSGRLALAPLTNTQSNPDGTLAEDELRWLRRRARGGFSLVSTCAAFVSEEGHAWRGQLGVADDAHLPGLRRLATSLRDEGAVSVVQLHHAGAKATLAPQKLSTADDAEAGVRGATAADLARVVADFVAAAQRAEAAGFDGVEVHGANGYLFTQFLSPADNPRTDAFGGDLVGRARLLRQTVQAVRAAVAPGFAVGVRLSPVDTWDRRGLVLADSLQVGQWLAEDGADFVHLSLRDASGPPPFEAEAGPVARAFRSALPEDVAVISVGGVWTAGDARRARESGADLVAVGKAAIAHGDLPRRMAEPGWEPQRPPFPRAHLRDEAVGASFMAYLDRFPGLVEGGAPARR